MTDYYIFRHGDTTDTEKSKLAVIIRMIPGYTDSSALKILPKSFPVLTKIGEFLKKIPTDANFSSPYPRCVDSAKIVGEVANKKYKIDQRIRELEHNGEPFSSFYERVKFFLDDVDSKNYSAVSICTHGAVLAAIKHLKTSGKFYFFQVFDYPPPGNLLIIKNGNIKKINFTS